MKMMKSALAAILVALGIAACNQSIDEVKGPTFPHVHRGNEPEKANGGPVRTSIDTDLMARRKIVFEASLNEFTDLKGKIVSSEEWQVGLSAIVLPRMNSSAYYVYLLSDIWQSCKQARPS
jgi:hypothetical protein